MLLLVQSLSEDLDQTCRLVGLEKKATTPGPQYCAETPAETRDQAYLGLLHSALRLIDGGLY